MKKSIFAVVWGLIILGLFLAAPAHAALSTFDSGNEGFMTSHYAGGSSYWDVNSTWMSTGGNTGGYISSTLNGTTDRIYGFAKYGTTSFGDLTGKYLTVDYMTSGTVTGPAIPLVRFYIGKTNGISDYWVTTDAYSWDPNSDTSWTTHLVSMIEDNWVKWPNQNTNTTTWSQVLLQYTDIGIVFADGSSFFSDNSKLAFTGTGTIGIDNFGASAVPIPATVWLFGSGLIGLIGLGRKKKG